MAATIKDIAKLAHVSIATVSRILSDRTESHTEETIARVRKAAKELAYQKNTAAIELVTKKKQRCRCDRFCNADEFFQSDH